MPTLPTLPTLIAAMRAHLLVHICMVALALVLENAGCALVLTRFARQASLVHHQISYDAGLCTNGNNGAKVGVVIREIG